MKGFTNALSSVQKIANEFSGAVTVKNTKRIYFLANDYWLKLLGLTSEQVIGKTDDEILSSENAAFARENDLKAFASTTPIEYTREVNIQGRALTYVTIKWVVYFSDGEPFCLCTLADILENREKVFAFRKRIDALFGTTVG